MVIGGGNVAYDVARSALRISADKEVHVACLESRAEMPADGVESEQRAATLDIIEEGYPEAAARREGSRCLRCNVNPVFDTSICVACNGCVDVCPEDLILPVGLSKLIEDPSWTERAVEEFGPEIREMPAQELEQMGKDETTCIRCAMCASRCPTAAILMKEFEFYRECVTAPARNPKVVYVG